MPPERITNVVLGDVRVAISTVGQFEFSLLKPSVFQALCTWPWNHQRYGGQFASIISHLTVAQGSESQIRAAEAALLSGRGRGPAFGFRR